MFRRLAVGIWWSSAHGAITDGVGGILMWTQAAVSLEGEEVKIGSMLSFSIAPFAVDGAYQKVAGFSIMMTWISGCLLALT